MATYVPNQGPNRPRIQDEQSAVFQQIMRREHPIAVLLNAAVSGHVPSRGDLDHVIELGRHGQRAALGRRLEEAVDEIHQLVNEGSLGPARRLARETGFECAPMLTEHRTAPSLFADEGKSPPEVAAAIPRRFTSGSR